MQANLKTPDQLHPGADARESKNAVPPADAMMGNNFMLTHPEAVPHEPESVGELLRAARESAGFSIGEIANRLRMGTKQIDAIERADYSALPQGIFLRGFIRNYAKVVGINIDEALATLERTHADGLAVAATKVLAPSAATPLRMHSRAEVFSTPKARILIVVGVVLLLAAAIWYWWEFVRPHLADGGRPRAADVVATTPAATQPQVVLQPTLSEPESKAGANSTVVIAPEKAAATGLTAPVAQSMVKAADPATSTPTAAANPVTAVAPAIATKAVRTAGDTGVIGFTFTGPSWVEVLDSTGRTILSRRYNVGDFDEVSGRGPFSIIVGNSTVTRMAYNGREFDLAPHTRANGTVARVTVK